MAADGAAGGFRDDGARRDDSPGRPHGPFGFRDLAAQPADVQLEVTDDPGELGVREEFFLRHSYWGLWLAAREEDPDLPEDMVFPQ
mgnify:CR=1 FL=1